MRIFTAVRHSNDPGRFYGGLWSTNFYPALRSLGHEVVESQTDLLPLSRFMDIGANFTAAELELRAKTTQQIMDEVSEALRGGPIDLFLSYFYNAHFDPSAFDRLRDLGIPSVNFYCNSIYQFHLVSEVAAKADCSWHAERDARSLYTAVGAKPVWVQMGADPGVYRPVGGISREPRACFVGQRYADRLRWVAALVQAGIPIDVYGAGWGAAPAQPGGPAAETGGYYLGRKRRRPGSVASYVEAVHRTMTHDGLVGGTRRVLERLAYQLRDRKLAACPFPRAQGAIPFEKMLQVFAGSEICLNFSNVWSDGTPGSRLVPHVRLRDFEAPMSRTCYLTGHTDEISDFYEVGREVETYGSSGELVEKSRYYLTHPAAAERLRSAGYERARRDHTWVRRFEQLFRLIGLRSLAGHPAANS